MSECTCHKNYTLDTLIPKVGVITKITQETPDVKTFCVTAPGGGKLFEHMPGQCAMVCVPGVGEAMFSITSSPTNKEYQEFSIKKCGVLTDCLHGRYRAERQKSAVYRRWYRTCTTAFRYQLCTG